jgi:hypothetical protein
VFGVSPEIALAPLANFELRSFRDAANCMSLWSLTVQDIVWGTHKAKVQGLLDWDDFNPSTYEVGLICTGPAPVLICRC